MIKKSFTSLKTVLDKLFAIPRKNVARLFQTVHEDVLILSLEEVENVLNPNVKITFNYILLIAMASVISTLGLLTNSTPVIVGGMIISPLMWPIVGTSFALWRFKRQLLKRSIKVLVLSVVFTLLVAMVLTILSPIKFINNEIISRTTPTLLDLFIAIASGAVAMLGLTNKKVSNSMAGVAIATSLLPPLCVSGIGIALLNFGVFWGGFLLFFTNAVAIMAVGIIYLVLTSLIKYKDIPNLDLRGVVTIAILFLLLIVPLSKSLREYSWNQASFQKSNEIIIQNLNEIDSNIVISKIQVENQSIDSVETANIDLELIVPEGISITFDMKEKLQKNLENSLQKNVNLNMTVQESLSIISEAESEFQQLQSLIGDLVKEQLLIKDPNIEINSINISQDQDILVTVNMIVDASNQFSEQNRLEIEKFITNTVQKKVLLNLEMIPRLHLKSSSDEQVQNIKSLVNSVLLEEFPHAELLNISLSSEATVSATPSAILAIQIRVPIDTYSIDEMIETLKNRILSQFVEPLKIRLRVIPVEEKEILVD